MPLSPSWHHNKSLAERVLDKVTCVKGCKAVSFRQQLWAEVGHGKTPNLLYSGVWQMVS